MNEPGKEVAVKAKARPSRNAGRPKMGALQPYKQLALMRELACRDMSQTALGQKYGITQQAVSEFAQRHALEIDEIREHMQDEFAGLPLVRKANRLAMYEDQIMKLREHPNADHHEWSKGVFIGLRNIAEELGDLPPRTTVTINPVVHMVQGVDIDSV